MAAAGGGSGGRDGGATYAAPAVSMVEAEALALELMADLSDAPEPPAPGALKRRRPRRKGGGGAAAAAKAKAEAAAKAKAEAAAKAKAEAAAKPGAGGGRGGGGGGAARRGCVVSRRWRRRQQAAAGWRMTAPSPRAEGSPERDVTYGLNAGVLPPAPAVATAAGLGLVGHLAPAVEAPRRRPPTPHCAATARAAAAAADDDDDDEDGGRGSEYRPPPTVDMSAFKVAATRPITEDPAAKKKAARAEKLRLHNEQMAKQNQAKAAAMAKQRQQMQERQQQQQQEQEQQQTAPATPPRGASPAKGKVKASSGAKQGKAPAEAKPKTGGRVVWQEEDGLGEPTCTSRRGGFAHSELRAHAGMLRRLCPAQIDNCGIGMRLERRKTALTHLTVTNVDPPREPA